VRSSAYGSRFRVQGLASGNVDPMRATELKTLAVFLLFRNLNAADILENEVLITKYRYCGRSTGEVGTTNWA
jgi:hypothetical protein